MSSASSTTAARRKPDAVRPRGDRNSARQIAHSVKDGRAAHFPDLELTGWFCGVDDYHWSIVDSSAQVHLVHKSAPQVTFIAHRIDDEPRREEILRILTPFREWIMRTHFAQHRTTA